MDMKVCSKCKRELPATKEYFHKCNKHHNDGLRSECKECRGWSFTNKTNNEKVARDGYKICPKCNRELKATIENFSKHIGCKYDLSYVCKECRKIYKKKYRAENKVKPEVKKAQNQRYYKKESYKLINRLRLQNRRASERELLHNFNNTDWINCKNYFNNECAYCGSTVSLEQEHFIPLTKNGEYTINNIIPACKSCNSSKNNSDFDTWYPKQLFYSLERENKILKYLGYKNGIQQLSIL